MDGNPNQRGSHFMEGIGTPQAWQSRPNRPMPISAPSSATGRRIPHRQKLARFLVPLYPRNRGPYAAHALVLLTAVGLLLLIACVNAANLLLARSSARVREIAVRSALGAARGRIVRQLLTESLVIASAGAALGALVAVGGVRVLVACFPADFPRASEIRLDSGGLCLHPRCVAVVTGLFFGLVPALTASRTDLQQGLREGGRGSTGGGRHLRLRGFLVVGETGLACVLLIAAGLMLHSFVNLLQADPGFRPQQVLTATISLPAQRYKGMPASRQFYDRLLHALHALPGVQSAGLGSDFPGPAMTRTSAVSWWKAAPLTSTTGPPRAITVLPTITFRAIGIPLERGRFFTEHDDADAPNAILINQAMAKRYWPGEDAVGKRISFNDSPTKDKDWITSWASSAMLKTGPRALRPNPPSGGRYRNCSSPRRYVGWPCDLGRSALNWPTNFATRCMRSTRNSRSPTCAS